MVRLKDPDPALCRSLYMISIPYGSIKRVDTLLECGLLNEFQFLMVRLKEVRH